MASLAHPPEAEGKGVAKADATSSRRLLCQCDLVRILRLIFSFRFHAFCPPIVSKRPFIVLDPILLMYRLAAVRSVVAALPDQIQRSHAGG